MCSGIWITYLGLKLYLFSDNLNRAISYQMLKHLLIYIFTRLIGIGHDLLTGDGR